MCRFMFYEYACGHRDATDDGTTPVWVQVCCTVAALMSSDQIRTMQAPTAEQLAACTERSSAFTPGGECVDCYEVRNPGPHQSANQTQPRDGARRRWNIEGTIWFLPLDPQTRRSPAYRNYTRATTGSAYREILANLRPAETPLEERTIPRMFRPPIFRNATPNGVNRESRTVVPRNSPEQASQSAGNRAIRPRPQDGDGSADRTGTAGGTHLGLARAVVLVEIPRTDEFPPSDLSPGVYSDSESEQGRRAVHVRPVINGWRLHDSEASESDDATAASITNDAVMELD